MLVPPPLLHSPSARALEGKEARFYHAGTKATEGKKNSEQMGQYLHLYKQCFLAGFIRLHCELK